MVLAMQYKPAFSWPFSSILCKICVTTAQHTPEQLSLTLSPTNKPHAKFLLRSSQDFAMTFFMFDEIGVRFPASRQNCWDHMKIAKILRRLKRSLHWCLVDCVTAIFYILPRMHSCYLVHHILVCPPWWMVYYLWQRKKEKCRDVQMTRDTKGYHRVLSHMFLFCSDLIHFTTRNRQQN